MRSKVDDDGNRDKSWKNISSDLISWIKMADIL